MSSTELNQNDQSLAEQSFFNLWEFDQIQVGTQTIKHNLNRWGLSLNNYRLKGEHVQIDVIPPYTEMNLVVTETLSDPDFYNKNVARITVSSDAKPPDSLLNIFSSKSTPLKISTDCEYLIFDSPYFYPHNWITMGNTEYLYNKIAHSFNYLRYFIQAYKDTFSSGIPTMYIKQTRETRNHYEIDVISKEYLTINYLKTDVPTNTLWFHILIETDKKTIADIRGDLKRVAQFHQTIVRIPRIIRTGNVNIKFVGNIPN